MNDLATMMWKEIKDTVLSGGRGAWIRPLVFISILGGLIPWQQGQAWLALATNPVAIFIASYLPFIFMLSFIGDVIAGERERHTLETLLASRISDQAILWGKLIVAVGYSMGMAIVGLLLAWVVANLAQGQGGWEFYHPLSSLIWILALSLLVSLLAASGGALVSLRSPTVRQAQQTLSIGSLVLFLIIFLVLRSIPAQVMAGMNLTQFLLILMSIFLVLDLVMLTTLAAIFRRDKLMLH